MFAEKNRNMVLLRLQLTLGTASEYVGSAGAGKGLVLVPGQKPETESFTGAGFSVVHIFPFLRFLLKAFLKHLFLNSLSDSEHFAVLICASPGKSPTLRR